MPRVTLDRIGTNLMDFNAWVYGQMGVNNLTQKELAQALMLDQPAIHRRLKGQTAWKLREVFELFALFGNTYEFRRYE